MIIVPMLGNSSRFKKEGILIPKFMLKIKNFTIFNLSVSTFYKYFDKEKFIFVINDSYEIEDFVMSQILKLEIKNYKIIKLKNKTRGQAETVYIALSHLVNPEDIYIFNIDTIIKKFQLPKLDDDTSGFLDVFIANGDNWSFIKPFNSFLVAETAEKNRISNLCSNGLYYFKNNKVFNDSFNKLEKDFSSELYVAPMFNYLIKDNLKVTYRITDSKNIEHAGIPKDYNALKYKYEN